MPVWPFGRRRRNQDGPQLVTQEKVPIRDDVRPVTPRNQGLVGEKSRKHSRKKRRKASPHKSTGEKKGNINLEYSSVSVQRNVDLTALPATSPLSQSPHLRPATVRNAPPPIPYDYQLNVNSTASLPPDGTPREQPKSHRPQSFQRPESMLTRKKSTKRKADPVREEEIRAMSAPVPIKRPATYSGSILRRDTKKVKDGLNKNLERPMSEVSLPMEESIHSSMSGTTDIRGFQVSSLDVFSARPRLRYSASMSVPPSGLQPISPSPPIAVESRKGKALASKLEHRDTNANDRIGELADDMNASSLREILERDARRRAKKKMLDEERLRRKLERRAEKQRAKEARAREPRREPEQGTLERRNSTAGLGIDNAKTSSISLALPAGQDAVMEDISADETFYEAREAPARVPFDSELTNMPPPSFPFPSPLQTPTEEPVVATAQAIRYSRGSLHQSPPTSTTHTRIPSNMSYLPDLLSEAPLKQQANESSDVDSSAGAGHSRKRRNSEASSKRRGTWASILRKATFSRKHSSDQGRTSPSPLSFTNTSRESMSKQPPPQHLTQSTSPVSRTKASGAPVRTSSKFREDLPELPLSPPDSRVQSPEMEDVPPPIPPISARRGLRAPSNIETIDTELVRQQPSPDDDRYTVAPESRAASPTSPQRASGLMSRSMASVDSEGSWLSGKPVKRPSTRQRYRSSLSSKPTNEGSNDEIFETANESSEENDIHEDIHDDEYFRRFTPTPENRMSTASDAFNRKPSSIALASGTLEVEEQPSLSRPPRPLSGDEILHTGVARIPTVVQHPTARVKSSEGLVNLFEAGEIAKSSPSEHPEGPVESNDPPEEHEYQFERAKSIELGRSHARQVSAGSAKLLNIKRIGSRNSPGPGTPPPATSRFDAV